MSTISTGTVTTAGTTTYVSGASSGIDTDALVTAGYEAKLASADKVDVKITSNEAIIAAYEELQTLGTALTTALESLKTTYGYSSADESVYTTREAYLATSDGGDVDSYLSITVDDNADQSSYSIVIEQLATAIKVNSDGQSSKTDALGMEGSLSLYLDGYTSVELSISTDMSLEDIADSINSLSDSTGVSATIIKKSDTEYALVVSGTETGESLHYSSTSGTDIFLTLGITDESGEFASVIQSAQDAIIYIDGMEITSSSNTIEDVLEGVTLTLYSVPATSNTTITLEVDYDYSGTKEAIQSFIDAYNDIRDFFITQQAANSDDSVLYSDTLLRTMVSSIYSIINNSFGSSDTVATLADMGITFDDENKLEISDEDLLNSVLLDNYQDVQSLFQTSLVTDADNLKVLRNTSTQSELAFSLEIEVDSDGNITSVSANGDTSAFTVSGTRLIGAEGTSYEGITLVYAGTESTTISVGLSQGLADSLYNLINNYTNTTSSIVQDKINSLADWNDTLQIKSDRIKDRAETYRAFLIEKYSAMEAAISSANSLLKQVQAILGTDSSDD